MGNTPQSAKKGDQNEHGELKCQIEKKLNLNQTVYFIFRNFESQTVFAEG
jgi:hypothetical protein